jgi:hypothetical protein
MQLHVARLCLDCEEVHDERSCPRCTSESYALLSKWVPAPERRARVRPPVDPQTNDVETYRQLLASDGRDHGSHPWLKGGALLAALSVGGWLWRRNVSNRASKETPKSKPGPSAEAP